MPGVRLPQLPHRSARFGSAWGGPHPKGDFRKPEVNRMDSTGLSGARPNTDPVAIGSVTEDRVPGRVGSRLQVWFQSLAETPGSCDGLPIACHRGDPKIQGDPQPTP